MDRFIAMLTCINNYINEIHTFGKSITQIDMMKGYDAAFTFGTIQCFTPFKRFFATHLILIKFSKIVNNDRNGQCDYQYAANTTHWSNDLSERSCWANISVTHRGHGNSCRYFMFTWNSFSNFFVFNFILIFIRTQKMFARKFWVCQIFRVPKILCKCFSWFKFKSCNITIII